MTGPLHSSARLRRRRVVSIKFSDLEIFIAIVAAGSISRAAENLAAPKSRISRHCKELEESLGTRLLERTTRSIRLTESGESIYRDALQILENVELCITRIPKVKNGWIMAFQEYTDTDKIASLFK